MKSTARLPYRRRREGRTDYRLRLLLLKGKKPRLVIRKSANNLTCQVVAYHAGGDQILVTANARHLLGLGWKGGTGSIPAAYLTGLLCGAWARKQGVTEAVSDLGLHPSTKWSRLYAALKGALDAGLKVPHSPEVLPPEDRLLGKHISSWAAKLKEKDPARYQAMFSLLLKNNLPPEQLGSHAEEIRKKIQSPSDAHKATPMAGKAHGQAP